MKSITKIVPEEPIPESRDGYLLPLKTKMSIISQGFMGTFSHQAYRISDRKREHVYDMRFALDFATPPGTEVLASRDGEICAVADSNEVFYRGFSYKKGLSVSPNLLIMQHDDGSKSVYSHLEQNSILFETGENVQAGDTIAKTGLSGWVGLTPHLHFEAFTQEGKNRYSFPVRFTNFTEDFYASKNPISSYVSYLLRSAFTD